MTASHATAPAGPADAPARPRHAPGWVVAGLPAAAVLGLTLLFRLTDADLAVSRLFFDPAKGTFPANEHPLLRFYYRWGVWPGLLVGLTGLVLGLGALWVPALRRWHARGWFLALSVILLPGVLVNDVFKEDFGRPRPRQVAEFGGEMAFLPVWQPGEAPRFALPGGYDAVAAAYSFPSGHVAIAASLWLPWFFLRFGRSPWRWFFLLGGAAHTLLMAGVRLAMGGHWASDCLWAAAFVWFGGWFFSLCFRLSADSAKS